MAAIVLRGGCAAHARRAAGLLRAAHALFRRAALLEFVDALPVTENGKVQKFRLRERGVTAATWDRDKAGYRVTRTAPR